MTTIDRILGEARALVGIEPEFSDHFKDSLRLCQSCVDTIKSYEEADFEQRTRAFLNDDVRLYEETYGKSSLTDYIRQSMQFLGWEEQPGTSQTAVALWQDLWQDSVSNALIRAVQNGEILPRDSVQSLLAGDALGDSPLDLKAVTPEAVPYMKAIAMACGLSYKDVADFIRYGEQI